MLSNSQDKALYEKVTGEWDQYLAQSSPFLEASQSGFTKTATGILNGDAKNSYDTLMADINSWSQLKIALGNQQEKDSAKSFAFA